MVTRTVRAAISLAVLLPWGTAGVAAQTVPPAARYAAALASAHPQLALERRTALAERVTLISSYYRLDPALLMALVSVESGWHAGAHSPVGALGLGQLMPQTAAALDVLPLRMDENLDGTARYLRRMLDRFGASERLALAAYNAGPAAVERFRGVPPYRETQNYVTNVMRLRDRLLAVALHAPPAPPAPAAHLAAPVRVVAHVARPVRLAHAPRHPSPNAFAYLVAPDPNGVPIADVPAPEPSAVPRVTVDPSTPVFKRLFGRHAHRGD